MTEKIDPLESLAIDPKTRKPVPPSTAPQPAKPKSEAHELAAQAASKEAKLAKGGLPLGRTDAEMIADKPKNVAAEAVSELERALTTQPKLTVTTLGGLKVEPVAEVTRYINILVYGDSGVGKTVLSGSASVVPEMDPVMFVDIEGGTMSLNASYPDVHRVRIKTWDDMQRVYDDLLRGKHGYKTVVLDSLTEINKFSMSNIMHDLVQSEPGRDPDIPSQREWGKNIEQTRRFVRAFRDLPMNVIFTALSVRDKDAKGMPLTRPSLPGKLAGEVAAFVDIVAYYYVKAKDGENKRFLLTTGTEKEVAKDRSGRLPPVVESPDMQKLYNLMYPTTKDN